ncbi:MAG: hypothetical protein PHV19_04535 [Bacilli bacterium]|nr:hypothetical protein [Bacilli bacterium]
MTIRNKKFAKWLGVYFLRNSDNFDLHNEKGEFIDSYKISSNTLDLKINFQFENLECQIRPGYYVTSNFNRSELFPELIVEINGRTDLQGLTKFIFRIYDILKFSFHREEIELGEITVSEKVLVAKDIHCHIEILNNVLQIG